MSMNTAIILFAASLCAGVGALLRAGVIHYIDSISTRKIFSVSPAMLVVNILGCALSALVLIFSTWLGLDSPWRICVTAGLLGGFTSFSTPCATSAHLIEQKRYTHAVRYALIMVVLCLLAYVSCAYLSTTLV
ncbi:FluC/FEX family fluoride channel [Fannyhessea vaginae]|uniref:FluC/FEX family fluoride channel n=1 Tax=Fannyhessea vaginae TaxID=82135 RepID=UPI00076FA2D6|nr:CrcB family protein [Fannyhessea vaginae]KXG89310.1 putative protein CrcB [Fannyhessea vaginae]